MFLTIVTYAKTYAKIRFAHSQFKKQGLRTSRNRKVCKTLDISFTTLIAHNKIEDYLIQHLGSNARLYVFSVCKRNNSGTA